MEGLQIVLLIFTVVSVVYSIYNIKTQGKKFRTERKYVRLMISIFYTVLFNGYFILKCWTLVLRDLFG